MVEQNWMDDLLNAPEPDILSLNLHELMLIDWTLCAASRLLSSPEEVQWTGLRDNVWAALTEDDGTEETKDLEKRHLIRIPAEDARILMATVPTTFRWGTGQDCGFNLKRRLYYFLQGLTPPEDIPKPEEEVAEETSEKTDEEASNVSTPEPTPESQPTSEPTPPVNDDD